METTTIKLRKTTKRALSKIKTKSQTYDDAISHLLQQSSDKQLEKKLVAGYKSIGKSDLLTLKEWDTTSLDQE